MPRQKVCCIFCKRSDENKRTGPLGTKLSATAHQNCLLYSSGIYCKNSPEFDELFGFLVEDVLTELKRGRRLTCHVCKKGGATVGCEVKTCKRSFHFPCTKPENLVKDTFRFYCDLHKLQTAEEAQADNVSESRLVPGTVKANTPNHHEAAMAKEIHLSLPCGRKNKSRKRVYSLPLYSSDEEPWVGESEHRTPPHHQIGSSFESERNDATEAKQSTTGAVLVPGDAEDTDTTDIDEQVLGTYRLEMPMNIMCVKSYASASCTECSLSLHSDPLEQPCSLGSHSGSESPAVSGLSGSSSGPSKLFWEKCNASGCTESIFSAFTSEMTTLSGLIQSNQASQEDYDLSMRVMKASGKLPKIISNLKKDLEKKTQQNQRAIETLNEIQSSVMR